MSVHCGDIRRGARKLELSRRLGSALNALGTSDYVGPVFTVSLFKSYKNACTLRGVYTHKIKFIKARFSGPIMAAKMESTSTTLVPKRVVLRFLEEYELEEWTILQAYFALFGLKPADDFFSHLVPANESPKMHIVLDLHYKSIPIVDLQAIEYQVFKVKKVDGFKFQELNESACKYARSQTQLTFWGTDQRYPEESDGVRL